MSQSDEEPEVSDTAAGVVWRKSSHSNSSNNCVEVAKLPLEGTALRDSKDKGDGPVLRFTPAEWDAFIEGVKAGEFD